MNIDELNDTTLVLERSFEAPPDRVFRSWTDPEELKKWYAPVEGWVVSKAEVDLRPGGGYRLEFGPPGGQPVIETGIYEEIVPSELLVFAIHLEGRISEESTRVRVEFTHLDGQTRVKIVEGGYSSKETRDMHVRGWSHCFDVLAESLT